MLRAYYNPLVPWIWFGAILAALGGLVSLSDRRLRMRLPAARASSNRRGLGRFPMIQRLLFATAAAHRARRTLGLRGRTLRAARRSGARGARPNPQQGAALSRLPEPVDRRIERRSRPRSASAAAPAPGRRRHRSAGPRLYRGSLRGLRAARSALCTDHLAALADATIPGVGRRRPAAAGAAPPPRTGTPVLTPEESARAALLLGDHR